MHFEWIIFFVFSFLYFSRETTFTKHIFVNYRYCTEFFIFIDFPRVAVLSQQNTVSQVILRKIWEYFSYIILIKQRWIGNAISETSYCLQQEKRLFLKYRRSWHPLTLKCLSAMRLLVFVFSGHGQLSTIGYLLLQY